MAKKKGLSREQRRLVCVRWADHTSKDDCFEFKDIDEELTPAIMLTVGWLVKEDSEAYYLAGTTCMTDGTIGDARCILKGTVKKIIDIGHE